VTRTLITAPMLVDGDRIRAAPGALLIDGERIVAAGSPQSIGRPEGVASIDEPRAVLIPALVNAHCHLDLSHIGPAPFTGSFVSWAERLRGRRATAAAEIAAAVRRGVALSRAGGIGLVGDIAGTGSPVPIRELRRLGMPGVSYLEVFGIGRRQTKAIAALRRAVEEIPPEEDGVRLGLQPHAPYSCGEEVYRVAAGLGRPLATHLAETPEELRFVKEGDGPLADLLRRLRVWDETILGRGRHPIEVLAESLAAAPFLAAHLNYVDSHHLELLRRWNVSVAYCPRASAYFGHPQDGREPHEYRSMLACGINVALGTDGLLCLDTPDRISVLDDMRLLYRRDGVDPRMLLRMGTIHGATALGFDPGLVAFRPGPTLGVLALAIDDRSSDDALRQVMHRDDAPRWVLGPFGIAPGENGEAIASPTNGEGRILEADGGNGRID
jgi:cytosine/adenosine deaminase-related metal-dependent hydrolase